MTWRDAVLLATGMNFGFLLRALAINDAKWLLIDAVGVACGLFSATILRRRGAV